MDIFWTVEKIKCDGCVKTIAECLLMIDGISDVMVDPNAKTVAFKAYTPGAADSAKRALVKAGFPPKA